tara:strand:+ start:346 stop:567 length:222 start_codon:yes stop_codon:yes gene_type:complete
VEVEEALGQALQEQVVLVVEVVPEQRHPQLELQIKVLLELLTLLVDPTQWEVVEAEVLQKLQALTIQVKVEMV